MQTDFLTCIANATHTKSNDKKYTKWRKRTLTYRPTSQTHTMFIIMSDTGNVLSICPLKFQSVAGDETLELLNLINLINYK